MKLNNIIFSIIIFFLLSSTVSALEYDTSWVFVYNGLENLTDSAVAIQLDSDGNIYVLGVSRIDDTSWETVLIKFRPSGDTAWVRKYRGVYGIGCKARAVCLDEKSNVYLIAGSTLGSVIFAYDSTGSFLWEDEHDPPGTSTSVFKIACADDGSVYIGGTCKGANLHEDYLVMKYDTSGAFIWERIFEGPRDSYDNLDEIIVNNDGSLIVTGSCDEYYSSNSGSDIVTVKYLPNGDVDWVGLYANSSGSDYWYTDAGYGLALDTMGNSYVVGITQKGGEYDWGRDFLTVKFDTAGNLDWARTYDYSGLKDVAFDVAVDMNDDIYVTGYIDNFSNFCTIKYLPGGTCDWTHIYTDNHARGARSILIDQNGRIWVSGTGSYSYNAATTLVCYDTDGNVLWDGQVVLNDMMKNSPVDMAIDSQNNIYIVGSSTTNSYEIDFFIAKLSSDVDGDGFENDVDNCKWIYNVSQLDSDGDDSGDECDKCPGYDDRLDYDNDSIPDDCDNCLEVANPNQDDSDFDGNGDSCDVCPGYDDLSDYDLDNVPDSCDNCPSVANAGQVDSDNDGIGDLCDPLSFAFEIDSIVAPASQVLKAADLDHDKNIDLIYSTTFDTTLSVSFGSGDLTFGPRINLLTDDNPTGLVFAFVNSDSLLDIIAVDTGEVFVLLNQGDKNFSVTSFVYPAGLFFNTAAAGYFNSDAYVDFVATPNMVFFGDGSGGFPSSAAIPTQFRSVDVSDFNNDGYDDLLITGLNDSASIYLNDGTGSFAFSSGIGVGTVSWSVKTDEAIADFNRDGNVDFALIVPVSLKRDWNGIIFIAFGDGMGGVIFVDTITINSYAVNIEVVDINDDNQLDLITGTFNNQLIFLINDGFGAYELQPPIDLGDRILSDPFVFDDFNRDGNPDLIGGNVTSENWTVAISGAPDVPVLSDEMVTTVYSNATLEVINPLERAISRTFQTVTGAKYYRLDIDNDGFMDERAYDYNLQQGEYLIVLKPHPGFDPGTCFCGGIRINGTRSCYLFNDYSWINTSKSLHPDVADSIIFYYTVEPTSSIYPSNGMKTNVTPIFSWLPLSDSIFNSPDSFNFQIDYYYDFRSPISDTVVISAEDYYLPEPLGIDSVYYWRIRAFENSSWTNFTRTFAIYVTDACCTYYTGNADCSEIDTPDISDITRLIDFLYLSHAPLCCPDEADANGSGGEPDISDITRLIDYLYLSHTPLVECP